MNIIKPTGVVIGKIKILENKICELLPVKTILAVLIIIFLIQLNVIKSDDYRIKRDLRSIKYDVSSIQSEVSSTKYDVSSIQSDVSSIKRSLR